ncbi:MAG: tetratricopeptide repeat protein [Candidatus Krumholzibacteriia bacterium]
MKTCPFLWRQSEAPTSGLLEKSVDLDGAGPRAGKAAAGGLNLACLGAVCRFHDAGVCQVERLGKLMGREEIAQGLQLATAALTDEIRTALDCTAGPLRALEQRLDNLPAPAAVVPPADDDGWREQVEKRLSELSERLDAWRDGAAAQTAELAAATAGVGLQVREVADSVAAGRETRDEAAAAAAQWQQSLQQRLEDGEERWENMVLSLTELSERIEASLGVVQEHIVLEKAQRERDDQAALIAAAKRENNAGVVFYHQGDLERAALRFEKALALAPEFVEAYNNLGLVETERGRAEEATRHFQRAIELDPTLSASYNNLGYVFFQQENYEEAIAMYQEAIERAANGSAAWTNLGNAHFKLGNQEKAREAWETAIELDPGNGKAAENLSRLLQATPA